MNLNYAIFRSEPIYTINDLAQIGSHNKREKKAYNSNPDIKIELSKNNIETQIEEIVSKEGTVKHKNLIMQTDQNFLDILISFQNYIFYLISYYIHIHYVKSLIKYLIGYLIKIRLIFF